MKNFQKLFLISFLGWALSFAFPTLAKVKRSRTSPARSATNQVTTPGATSEGTVFAPAVTSTYQWPEANTCPHTPAIENGVSSSFDIDISATNTTHTCNISTDTTGSLSLFGRKEGLDPFGIGTNFEDKAFSTAAGGCWFDTTATGFGAVNEGTNFHWRFVFRHTTASGTKTVAHLNTSASEYRRAEVAAALTWTLREGTSGNQTITHTPHVGYWHVYDLVFISDCNGDAGNPCVYCYYDGGLCEGTGGTMTSGTELAVNMATFGALTSIGLGCTASETNMFTGEWLSFEENQGATFSDRFGAAPANYLARHRADCQALGICSSRTTHLAATYGQSKSLGFSGIATSSPVSCTSNVTTWTVTSGHGVLAGDTVTSTLLSQNCSNVTVSNVTATTVSASCTCTDANPYADSTGLLSVRARTLTESFNNRHWDGTTLNLAIGGVGTNTNESPVTQMMTSLSGTYGRTEQIVAVTRGVSDTSITALNEETGDGTDATTHWDNLELIVDGADDRIAGLGSTTLRAYMIYDQGETDRDLTTWAEFFELLQADADQDFKTYTGQSDEVFICFAQISNWTAYSQTTAVIAGEQLDAHEAMSGDGRAFLSNPQYGLTTVPGDGIHLITASYQDQGRYFARCVDSVLDTGTWSPTRPTAVACSGTQVTVTIHAPVPPLVTSASPVTDPTGGNFGFEYTDGDAGADPTITSVNCSAACTGNSCSCAVNFSSSPCALTGRTVRYAWTGTSGNAGGPTSGARGTIADSETTDSLPNRLVHFSEAIP